MFSPLFNLSCNLYYSECLITKIVTFVISLFNWYDIVCFGAKPIQICSRVLPQKVSYYWELDFLLLYHHLSPSLGNARLHNLPYLAFLPTYELMWILAQGILTVTITPLLGSNVLVGHTSDWFQSLILFVTFIST